MLRNGPNLLWVNAAVIAGSLVLGILSAKVTPKVIFLHFGRILLPLNLLLGWLFLLFGAAFTIVAFIIFLRPAYD